jgi:hypothetical protein
MLGTVAACLQHAATAKNIGWLPSNRAGPVTFFQSQLPAIKRLFTLLHIPSEFRALLVISTM